MRTLHWLALGICLLAAIQSASGLYSASGPVTILDAGNFKSKLKGSGVWMVEFFAPWCAAKLPTGLLF